MTSFLQFRQFWLLLAGALVFIGGSSSATKMAFSTPSWDLEVGIRSRTSPIV